MNNIDFQTWLNDSFRVDDGQDKAKVISNLMSIVRGAVDYSPLKEMIGREHSYRTMPPEKFFYRFSDMINGTNRMDGTHEFILCTACRVYFYGCFGTENGGKQTKPEWNAYVKRCPECHRPENFVTVLTNRWIDGAIPMKDHCYGSDHYKCRGKKDLPGAKCSDWGRGEYGEYCKDCFCRACCGEEYNTRCKENA